MANENGARLRFRPAGSAARQHGAPEYGPLGTGCPVVEQAVTALYKAQNEESFWTLMNALNYALELDTRVLVPLQAAPDSEKEGASWAEHPVPAEKARELDPWTTSATLDASLLNGLLHASRDTDEPGEEELHKGSQAALAGQWADALHYYEQAAEQGRAEALSMLGELLYEGKGVRRSAVQARRMWKKAAEAGDVLAMIALGDDCMASGKGPGAALRYYRQAQTAARPTPDIAYMPQVRLRMAQYETQYLSRPRALAEMAEAKQGFKIRLGEGDPAAEQWLQETEDAIRRLLGDEKR